MLRQLHLLREWRNEVFWSRNNAANCLFFGICGSSIAITCFLFLLYVLFLLQEPKREHVSFFELVINQVLLFSLSGILLQIFKCVFLSQYIRSFFSSAGNQVRIYEYDWQNAEKFKEFTEKTQRAVRLQLDSEVNRIGTRIKHSLNMGKGLLSLAGVLLAGSLIQLIATIDLIEVFFDWLPIFGLSVSLPGHYVLIYIAFAILALSLAFLEAPFLNGG